MAQYETYTSKFFGTDFMKDMMPANTMFPFDLGSLMEMQRKNMQAITELQQMTVENLQAMTQLQTEMMSQIVQDNTDMAQQIMAEGTPEEKVALQADMMRKVYEHSMTGMTELGDLVAKSGKETGEVISKRVTASLTEFKSSVQKAKAKATGKAA
jgi:phasin family protein